ncbi:MAG: ABC transporter permease [Armatimonadota bacterium]
MAQGNIEQVLIDPLDSTEQSDFWPEEKRKNALQILFEHRELVFSLILRDIRSRYKQSALGIAWALLQPLALTIVYTIVFSHITKVDTGGIPYPIFSYIAMLPWTFFSLGLISGTECLTSNYNLITKIYFPREVFPIASTLGKIVDLMLGILVLIPFFFYYQIHVTPTVLLVIPVFIIQICFLMGLTFAFSSINLFYRDIRHAMPLLTQVWMYLSPIIYPLSLVPSKYLNLYMINPMAVIMDSYRRTALLGQMPDWKYLAISALISIVVLVIGYRIFKKLEPSFAEMI